MDSGDHSNFTNFTKMIENWQPPAVQPSFAKEKAAKASAEAEVSEATPAL